MADNTQALEQLFPMNSYVPAAPATGNPLTPQQFQQITTANERSRKIRRAAAVAAFNGWSLGVCAVVSTLFLPLSIIPFSPTAFIVAAALWTVTIIEFRGRQRLLAYDPTACRLLGWNQIGLLLLLVGYCLWSILNAYFHPTSLLSGAISPELQGSLDLTSFEAMIFPLTLVVYGTVIVVAILVQGGNALYYFTRERLVRSFLAETEPWVIEVQKSAAAK
jgi:hypothetical protein